MRPKLTIQQAVIRTVEYPIEPGNSGRPLTGVMRALGAHLALAPVRIR